MHPGTGISDTGNEPPESILSITHHFINPHLFRRAHWFCLIITEKRIICFSTDELLASRRKDALAGKISVPAGPLGFLMMALSLDKSCVEVEFSEYFGKMHPSRIIAEHPDAEIIAMKDVISFALFSETVSLIDYGYDFHWVIKISGRLRTIELFTKWYPVPILDNEPLKALLGDRFVQPKTDFVGCLLLGRKLD